MESNNEILLSVCKDIPNHESFIKIEAINKGLSGDENTMSKQPKGNAICCAFPILNHMNAKKDECTI